MQKYGSSSCIITVGSSYEGWGLGVHGVRMKPSSGFAGVACEVMVARPLKHVTS